MRKINNSFVTFSDALKDKHTQSYSDQYFNEHPHKYNLFGFTLILHEFFLFYLNLDQA